jgi:hypothetical protein
MIIVREVLLSYKIFVTYRALVRPVLGVRPFMAIEVFTLHGHMLVKRYGWGVYFL